MHGCHPYAIKTRQQYRDPTSQIREWRSLIFLCFTHLAVTLSAGTLTHVDPAGLEVELGRDGGVAGREEGALDGGAVELRLDASLPVTPAGGGLDRNVPGQDRAGLPPPNPPGVPELLAGPEKGSVAAHEVVPLVAVEVPAEATHLTPHLGRQTELQEADPVPQ